MDPTDTERDNRPSRRVGRRKVLAVGAAGAVSIAGCALAPHPSPMTATSARAAPAEVRPLLAEQPEPLPEPPAQVLPAPVPAPPMAALNDLGVAGIAQPFWSGQGDRILYYDQPQPGLDGTWAADPVTGRAERERPQWGYYVSRGTLLVTPRPQRRETYVMHLPTGREWTLATTNSALFTADGTMVLHSAAAPNPPGVVGGGGGPGNFQTTTFQVSWADGQNAQRIALPINASPVVWMPGKDGTPNQRVLLTGRRNRTDVTGFYILDVNNKSLVDLVRHRRITGVNPSPDGTWVAFFAMWNADTAQNGLWVMRTDGSDARRLDLVGGYRWTESNRLVVIPVRNGAGESHEVWDVEPTSGEMRRLTDGNQLPFRVSNFDWDMTPDGTGIVFVDAVTRRLTSLTLPTGLQPLPATQPSTSPGPVTGSGKPYRLPFASPSNPSGWYVAQWYGITTTGYRARNSAYSQGQGIHFGIDFATPYGTPVVAVAPGRVVAIDGGYGSPPHNVVIQTTDNNQIMYGHLREPSQHVQVGQTVEAGQVVGNSGDSSFPYDGWGNPHLHLEVRKNGRDVATNLVPHFDVNWDDFSLGAYPGPRFERDLDNPRRYQFPDDQPDIRFGGAIISNFSRPWPP
jgi:hypothetical protein